MQAKIMHRGKINVTYKSVSEITVILKAEDKTYKEKFLCYDEFTVSATDETLLGYVQQAKANFKADPEEITIKISYTL